MSTWGTTEAMPFTADVLAAATAAGCAQIVELPCGSYVAGFNADPAPDVPQTVTMKQARLALLNASLYTATNSAIAAMTGPAGQAAQIEWEFSATVSRSDVLMTGVGTTLGLTSEQIDALFIAAALIQPS